MEIANQTSSLGNKGPLSYPHIRKQNTPACLPTFSLIANSHNPQFPEINHTVSPAPDLDQTSLTTRADTPFQRPLMHDAEHPANPQLSYLFYNHLSSCTACVWGTTFSPQIHVVKKPYNNPSPSKGFVHDSTSRGLDV